MRLLKTAGSYEPHWQPQLCDYRGQEYAILSHRWQANPNHEVLFADIAIIDDGGSYPASIPEPGDLVYNTAFANKQANHKPGFEKLRGAAQQALRDEHLFIWVDTCCIDKGSSAELSEAINSMWTYYSKAKICYAYLEDVENGSYGVDISPGSPFAESAWWTRGWTLQELIAPFDVLFFTRTWDKIGEKQILSNIIVQLTGISLDVLTHARRLESVSVAKRMSWASKRITTRPEDLAYCLMGIFSVNMPLLYGEGERAFLRLQEEIMKDSDDHSIFAWVNTKALPESQSGLLASHPSYFENSADIVCYDDFEDREPYVMSNRGLSMTVQLSLAQDGTFAAALHCPVPSTGEGYLAIYLKRHRKNSRHYSRVKCAKLGSLEKRGVHETIYVRQTPPTQNLDTVLPYHYFHLRKGPPKMDGYVLTRAKYASQYDASNTQVKPSPTSYAKTWVKDSLYHTFRVVRGADKLSAALLFTHSTTDLEPERQAELGHILVLLGSISSTQVGFDAHQLDNLSGMAELEQVFKPRLPGSNEWIELEDYHVRVEIEPESRPDDQQQLFVTDITISHIEKVRPLEMMGRAVTSRIEALGPRLSVRQPDQPAQSRGKEKIWQRLGRKR